MRSPVPWQVEHFTNPFLNWFLFRGRQSCPDPRQRLHVFIPSHMVILLSGATSPLPVFPYLHLLYLVFFLPEVLKVFSTSCVGWQDSRQARYVRPNKHSGQKDFPKSRWVCVGLPRLRRAQYLLCRRRRELFLSSGPIWLAGVFHLTQPKRVCRYPGQ